MRHVWGGILVATCLLAAMPVAAQSPALPGAKPAQRPLPPQYATKQLDLAIPFSVTQGTTPDTQAARVDVLVSWDQGRNWHKYTEVPPDAGTFRFRAKKDGEFWFLTQTIDSRGRGPRDEVKWPQLRLIIDTQKPDLRMTAVVTPSGRPELAWTVVDTTLNPATFKLEYQDAGADDSPWESISVPDRQNVMTRGGLVGQTSFAPVGSPRQINVRAEVADAAGNTSYFSQQLTLPSADELANASERSAKAPALADASAKHWPSEDEKSPPENGLADGGLGGNSEPQPKVVENPFAGKGRLASRPTAEKPEPLPSDPPEEMPLPERSRPGSGFPKPETPSQLTTKRPDLSPTRPSEQEALPPPFSPSGSPQELEPETGDIGPVGEEPLPPTAPSKETLPPAIGSDVVASDAIPAGDRPRLTNTRRFTLDYDVEAVGPEGVADVELWGTNDAGKTWIKWGTDPDRISPMDVEVSNETVYGFRVVVVGKNGLEGNRPAAGDDADIWVGIDVTAPTARITAAAYGQGEHAGELDIRWEAADANLSPRPVTLLYSDRPDGKYTTIAAGLPNKGQYYWQFDPRSPRKLYLRLEVRDDAGNIATDQLAEPINIEGLTPKARIKSFTPAADSPRGAFRQPLFR